VKSPRQCLVLRDLPREGTNAARGHGRRVSVARANRLSGPCHTAVRDRRWVSGSGHCWGATRRGSTDRDRVRGQTASERWVPMTCIVDDDLDADGDGFGEVVEQKMRRTRGRVRYNARGARPGGGTLGAVGRRRCSLREFRRGCHVAALEEAGSKEFGRGYGDTSLTLRWMRRSSTSRRREARRTR
jgi:hypothetical protein